MKKFRATFIALVIVLVVVVIFGLNDVREEGVIQYRVSGRVLEEGTERPLEGVEVMVLLDKWPTEDPKRLERLFDAYSARWNGKFPGRRMGLSGEKGKYVSAGSRKYQRRYKTLFGMQRTFKRPFNKAWVVYQKPGYETVVKEFSTKGWELMSAGAEDSNELPEVELESLSGEK
ncbi:MAG: hypothetical protein GF408_06800 [Candidatus Omnitrophica bacterium]|nr:hypothetical protein [Candidatus Omnitrophota bacterium]